VGPGLLAQVDKVNAYWMKELDLEKKSLPPADWRTYTDWSRNVRFMAAATRGRDPAALAAALARNEALDGLLRAKSVQQHVKVLIGDVLRVIEEHWSARLSVILMSEAHLSRSEYDALRHLLSFIYDDDKDLYERIIVWVNPCDERDTLKAPALASRYATEKERAFIYAQCGAEASEDGIFCGVKDLETGMRCLVESYWDAIDPEVQAGRKELQLVLTGDATGGWRGDSITHGEMAFGSFVEGKALSKLAALPVWLMEGDDGSENLRARCARVFEQYNEMKLKGTMTVTINGEERILPTKCLI
jgi:hypothetical protein